MAEERPRHRSHWLREALASEPAGAAAPPLRGRQRADVAIVGGGFTGLWTALQLKALEPALEVAILEADICGGGASGRNGGFVMTWMSKAPTLLKLCGAQEGVRLLKESEAGVRAIGGFCREAGIGAHFRHDGWLWTATNRAQLGSWVPCLEALDKLGLHPFAELAPAEVQRRAGSKGHLAGVFEPGVATVQPALLARALRRKALEAGVRIHEGSPMTELRRTSPPSVATPEGELQAGTVVLALNAWAHELPEFRRSVYPVSVDQLATEPAPERLARIGLADGVAISDSRLMVDYYRTTIDGRMVFGKGGAGELLFGHRIGRKIEAPGPRSVEVLADLYRLYPDFRDCPVAVQWRGPAARTATGLPFFGRLAGAPSVVYGHGYSGNGVGPSYLGGKILASLALGRRDEWAETPLARGARGLLPPEPIRYLGGLMVRRAAMAKDRAEDEGREPSIIARRLAALAPSGLTPKRKG
jgi:putative aminophosphonate oxidoreductase